MLNLLSDYICGSLPDTGSFSTNPNLRKKVGEDGRSCLIMAIPSYFSWMGTPDPPFVRFRRSCMMKPVFSWRRNWIPIPSI